MKRIVQSSYPPTQEPDKSVMQNLSRALGPSRNLLHWSENGDPCSEQWEGVSCTRDNGHVIQFVLGNKDFSDVKNILDLLKPLLDLELFFGFELVGCKISDVLTPDIFRYGMVHLGNNNITGIL